MIGTSEAAALMAVDIIVQHDVTHAGPLTTRRAPMPPTTGRSTPTRSNAAARSAARRISDAGAAMQGVSAAQADADPGVRLRTFTFGPERADTDISEPMARAIFEAAPTPEIWEIEAKMRAAVGPRA